MGHARDGSRQVQNISIGGERQVADPLGVEPGADFRAGGVDERRIGRNSYCFHCAGDGERDVEVRFLVHRESHALPRLVAATLTDLGGALQGHRVVNRIPPDLIIDADGELLQLALRQLLNNAVKYSPSSSVIEIEAENGDAQAIVVRNSGSVIPEHEQRRIFDRFYRGADARRIPGTGMGLSIVQQIARAHGGIVTVSSSAAAGTEFRISLPVGAAVS